MSINDPTPKPAEWLHTKECLAEALISAIQNMRDQEQYSNFDFRVDVQANQMLEDADEYLNTGLQTCICPEGYQG